ncbi:DVU0298 family protein [Candidatus Electronema sp. PJ]|uniref:DVU0298 family protein n=1 Tax=Candidatus Electronema sp. PJ TaxID=3401572 RepID=UPI003AA888AC
MSARKDKQQILDLLHNDNLAEMQQALAKFAAKEVVNTLFAAICRSEEQLRWHAIAAMGWTVSQLAEQDREEARIIIRRLLWSLNEESGGIGWGAPEALAEILCQHHGLAEEYVHMLLSYMRPDGEEAHQDGNFLEHEALQRGLLWAAGRLAQGQQDLVLAKGMADDLPQYLDSPDATVRGLAARAIGLLGSCPCLEKLRQLTADQATLRVYDQGCLNTVTVGELASQAVANLQ